MQQVRVELRINAPIERVFEVVADHERFLRRQMERALKYLQAGRVDRCGLGCIRKVTVGKRAWYVEEITAWKSPAYFEYTIRKASIPIRHEVSRLTFKVVDGATDVEWTSRFDISIPLLGGLLGARARKLYTKAFTNLFVAAKTQLETRPTSVTH